MGSTDCVSCDLFDSEVLICSDVLGSGAVAVSMDLIGSVVVGSAGFGGFCLSSMACFQGGSLEEGSISFPLSLSSFFDPNSCFTPNLLIFSCNAFSSGLPAGLVAEAVSSAFLVSILFVK